MRNFMLGLVLAAAPLIVNAGEATPDYDDWQRQILFQPTPRDLARERSGRVHIYDGMKDSDIERAMQTQFDRVAGMMFVRTVVTDDSGTPIRDEVSGDLVLEDDDCD